MKKSSTFLKLVIYLIVIAVLALSILFTFIVVSEGKNLFFPILVIFYVTAIPFFFAIYQTLKILSYIENNKAFSKLSANALKKIKYCAITISALYVAGMPFFISIADKDDAPGAALFPLLIILASIAIATLSSVFQKLVHKGMK